MTDARGRAREPLVLQLPHQLREPLSRFEADEIGGRHRDVVERDLRGVDECMPSFSSRRETRHARQRRVDDEQRHAVVARVGIGLGDEREEVRTRAVGDEHLAAVDAPDVAVARRAGADRGDVRAGVGFGDRDRADLRARDRGPQPALALVVGAELGERGRGHVRLHRDGHRDRARAAAGQLLDEDEPGGEVAAAAAPAGREVQAEEAELAAAAEDVVGKVPGVFPLDDVRSHLGVDEPPDRCPQLLVLGREDRMAHHRRQRCHTGAATP